MRLALLLAALPLLGSIAVLLRFIMWIFNRRAVKAKERLLGREEIVTTEKAADLLGISHSYLLDLIDEKEILFETDRRGLRRVRVSDMLILKEELKAHA
jgi:excisionase family DNA binding protein